MRILIKAYFLANYSITILAVQFDRVAFFELLIRNRSIFIMTGGVLLGLVDVLVLMSFIAIGPGLRHDDPGSLKVYDIFINSSSLY